MTIIKPSTAGINSTILNLIPREKNFDEIKLIDENTKNIFYFDTTSISHYLSISSKSYYEQVTLEYDSEDFEFKENQLFDMVVYKNKSIVYKGKLFVTSQNPKLNLKFDNNVDEYTTPSNDDDKYIILE